MRGVSSALALLVLSLAAVVAAAVLCAWWLRLLAPPPPQLRPGPIVVEQTAANGTARGVLAAVLNPWSGSLATELGSGRRVLATLLLPPRSLETLWIGNASRACYLTLHPGDVVDARSCRTLVSGVVCTGSGCFACSGNASVIEEGDVINATFSEPGEAVCSGVTDWLEANISVLSAGPGNWSVAVNGAPLSAGERASVLGHVSLVIAGIPRRRIVVVGAGVLSVRRCYCSEGGCECVSLSIAAAEPWKTLPRCPSTSVAVALGKRVFYRLSGVRSSVSVACYVPIALAVNGSGLANESRVHSVGVGVYMGGYYPHYVYNFWLEPRRDLLADCVVVFTEPHGVGVYRVTVFGNSTAVIEDLLEFDTYTEWGSENLSYFDPGFYCGGFVEGFPANGYTIVNPYDDRGACCSGSWCWRAPEPQRASVDSGARWGLLSEPTSVVLRISAVGFRSPDAVALCPEGSLACINSSIGEACGYGNASLRLFPLPSLRAELVCLGYSPPPPHALWASGSGLGSSRWVEPGYAPWTRAPGAGSRGVWIRLLGGWASVGGITIAGRGPWLEVLGAGEVCRAPLAYPATFVWSRWGSGGVVELCTPLGCCSAPAPPPPSGASVRCSRCVYGSLG